MASSESTSLASGAAQYNYSTASSSAAAEARKVYPLEDGNYCGLERSTRLSVLCALATLAFSVAGGSYLAPFFPSYALSVGFSETQIGLIFAVDPLLSLLVACFACPYLLMSTSSTTLICVSSAISGSAILSGMLMTLRIPVASLFVLGIALRAVAAVGNTIGSAGTLALLLQNLPEEELPEALGVREAADGMAFVVGPILGGATPVIAGKLPCWPFTLVSALVFAVGIPFCLLPRLTGSNAGKQEVVSGPASMLHALWLAPDVLRGFLCVCTTIMGIVAIDPLIGPQLNAAPLLLTNMEVSFFYVWGALVYAASSILLSPMLQRRLGGHLALVAAAPIAAAGLIGLGCFKLVGDRSRASCIASAVGFFGVGGVGNGVLMSAAVPLMLRGAKKEPSLSQPEMIVAALTLTAQCVGCAIAFLVGTAISEAANGDFRVIILFGVLQSLLPLAFIPALRGRCCPPSLEGNSARADEPA